ncbi:actin filament-associated protein 1-like 2 [Puma concolor]|uniref:Actin filament-associated protein 1-like 2 n=1 Tax=Puma concolor TaxID=9696 RepID=A0A6P6HCX5_PUMCO|nr:actin filament-associated protein 1-like 2 [Puma concolor]
MGFRGYYPTEIPPEEQNPLPNGEPGQHSLAPQKSLPDLPPPKIIPERKQLSVPKIESPEGYYEEAEPYDTSLNGHCGGFSPTGIPRWVQVPDGVIYATITLEDGEAVSSSYESYDEEENSKGKSAPYQWPSPEAGIELMRDARICAFLWRKKWLGQWAKQLCVVKDTRLLPDVTEKYGSAPEYGSSVDGHPEVPEAKDVKKKCSTGLKLSNLMNLGRKKSTSLEPPDRSLETSSYLNVLVNSQWKSRWCSVRDSHLHFYLDRNRSKVAQQPVSLLGCEVVPDPSPDHLYSFRILHHGEELAKLEAKSSEEMGHWLGLLLSESGSKTDPEEFTYDYVDADRVSCIVSAAKTSLLLMQRKFSEPNTYIDGLPSQDRQEMLYDDVEVSELTAMVETLEAAPVTDALSEPPPDRVYLDLTPVKSFLHSPSSAQTRAHSPLPSHLDPPAEALPADPGPAPDEPLGEPPENPKLQQTRQESPESEEPSGRLATVKIQTEQKISFPSSCPDTTAVPPAGASPPVKDKLRVTTAEIKLGKNRTEAEVKRYTEEKERLEKKKEEIRGHLAQLRKEKRELRETLLKCTDKGVLASLEQKLKEIDEECRVEESRRVDLELNIVEVKDNLKKAEAGPVTLGTTVDTTHLENVSPRPKAATPTPAPDCTPVNSATALKNRPLSVMVTGKGTVLQKAKEWEKKGTS